MIRVVVIARTLPARTGLRALLESDRRYRVVGDAPNLSGVSPGAWDEADVLLLDADGLDPEPVSPAQSDLASSIVVIGGSSQLGSALSRAGAPLGMLGPGVSAEQIQAAVSAVAAGLSVMEPAVAAARRSWPDEDDVDAPNLTPREREVLELVAAGLPNKGIAARLGISDHTVKFHLASVLMKLAAASRAEAVAQAARLGLIAL